MDLKKIKSLAEEEKYEQALEECNEYLKKFPDRKADILRVRAYTFSLLGNYESALQDRKIIFEIGESTIKDYYLAANNALSLGEYKQACIWLDEVLRIGKDQNETWFDSGAYFLLAYAQMELKCYKEAINNLNNAVCCDPNCAMPLPNLGLWKHDRLKQEIEYRTGRMNQ